MMLRMLHVSFFMEPDAGKGTGDHQTLSDKETLEQPLGSQRAVQAYRNSLCLSPMMRYDSTKRFCSFERTMRTVLPPRHP